MIKSFWDEKWKEVKFEYPLSKRYAISNCGRLLSFTDSMENGRLLKGGLVEQFIAHSFCFQIEDKKKYSTKYIHRLVAEYFILRDSEEQTFVIHLDYNKLNNHFTNLKWATYEEHIKHKYKSPGMLENRRNLIERNLKGLTNRKLTETQVIRIKKMLFNPKRKTRMRIIAKQFGISEMQLYRIKSGENWGHIKI